MKKISKRIMALGLVFSFMVSGLAFVPIQAEETEKEILIPQDEAAILKFFEA